MQYGRFGSAGYEKPMALAADDTWRDVSALVPDIDVDLIISGLDAESVLRQPPVPANARIGAPIARVGKIVCVGLNYRDHAAETGAAEPNEPILFMKAPDTIVGPFDHVTIPLGSTKTDWEVELAVLVGRTARYVASPDQAADHIAGFMISNDVSERSYQLERGGQWDKGKNCETFNPLGPYVVTPDEISDAQDLNLRLWVNGEQKQDGNTGNMIFGVNHLIWYISQFMVLYPGDVINTGTPAGVAMGLTGQPYLRPGDTVELEIQGLGRQRQTFQDAQ